MASSLPWQLHSISNSLLLNCYLVCRHSLVCSNIQIHNLNATHSTSSVIYTYPHLSLISFLLVKRTHISPNMTSGLKCRGVWKRQHVPPKCWYTSTKHHVTCQRMIILKITTTRASHLIPVLMFLNKLMQYQFTYLTVAKQWITQISKDEGL